MATKVNLSEYAKSEMIKNNESLKDTFRNDYNTLVSILNKEIENNPLADHLLGGFHIGLCPYIQFIGIESLPKEKLFNGIPENGVYVSFEIDMIEKSVEIHHSGHVEMTDDDKKATYLCMFGLKNIAKAYNIKWLRKFKYKDMNDLAKRIVTFYNNIMNAVNDLTEGNMKRATKNLVAKSV